MNPLTLLLTGVGLLLTGGLGSLLLVRRPALADSLLRLLPVAGLAAVAAAAILVLRSTEAVAVPFAPPVPGGIWLLGVDPLSAWFLIILSAVGAAAALYGVPFLASERGSRPVAVSHALLMVLLAAMVLVLTAQAVVLFLLAWETMALSAYLLIMYEGEQRAVRRDGLVYLVMTHVGALALLAMFLIWGRGGPDLTFRSLAAHTPGLPWRGGGILLLALLGFGGKAGLVPLHIWVPGADAAEPSHVSAVLSGVMLKVGIYGLLRVLTLLGAPPAWFGWTLLALGLGSGVLGVLWALGERDLKRVLAYSSVENIGIILLGLGVGVLGVAYSVPAMAVLGFTGALLHVLNHALFKSLLFLGAGAVLRATGTRLIDQLGGLGRELPWTAVAFGVGAVAIVGLPPLNGFVSEWVAVQGLLTGAQQPGLLALLLLGVAGLGLIGALALACFSRAVGGVFLGQPRRPRAPVREQWGLVAPMLALAAGCIAVGVFPGIVLGPVSVVVSFVLQSLAPVVAYPAAPLGDGLWVPGALLGLLIAVGGVVWSLRHWRDSVRQARSGITWSCAYPAPTSRMQYTAGSFSSPLRLLFGVAAAWPGKGPAIEGEVGGDRASAGFDRIWNRARTVAALFRPLQQQPVTRYLQYMVLTVLLLLGALFASLVRR